ncbi:DUF1592 domain-containing protein [Stieleria varia]|uniref:Planctomycete cytochrome C n=1 Tax=Stieleria varia TaxID=2528005 RepID=A0A5C6B894_9BACT|nr:DUF1592 domain-containing protein [Stieleria varia]TWU07987.1 hypothetical protein Pla52n_05640 [Stieleria varia]
MPTSRLSRPPLVAFFGLPTLVVLLGSVGVSCVSADDGAPTHFAKTIAPFLTKYCVDCHSEGSAEGGIVLDRYTDSANVQTDYQQWERIDRLIQAHQMPPADSEQPSAQEIMAVAAAIEVELSSFDCSTEKHPGRVTIRRLNRPEYDNTVRDLVGLDLHLADDFPSDDVGSGFDNIGDVLTLPPILMEKYIDAAATIAAAITENEDAKRLVFPHEPASDAEQVEVAVRNVREFAARAFRRPLTDQDRERLDRIMSSAWEQTHDPQLTIQTILTAILSSPHFLFRVEQEPTSEDQGIRALDGYELASRLSYFLWSSMPDARLFELAESGKLIQADVLAEEAKRMLADPKSRALVDNFAGQWLQLREVDKLTPDPETFPGFDTDLRTAMRRETEVFFETMIREDRSVLEFLTADFTYVNERLAQHYGIADVSGDQFQRVSLGPGRRGVLTHASILMLTSNPTRTSPVKRGKWILENMLAEPPPPAPANVPALEEGGETLGSLREQMEQHRSNETCAVCHRTMDALGFGLENFDAIGGWRDQDGRFAIDSSGELPGGKKFDGAVGLMQILAEDKKDAFCRCLTEKLLTYALGRGLGSYDRCTVKSAATALQENDYRFSALVTAIVTSDPFTLREQ